DEAEDTFALEHDDEAEDTFELEQNDEEESTFEFENDTDELDDIAIPDDVDLDIATPSEVEPDGPLSEEVQTSETQENDLKLDNPDLDLAALLSDGESEGDSQTPAEDFLDVESLMDDGDDGNTVDPDSQMLDLDVSLSDFTGVSDEDTVIDIDKDAGQNANLDLARAYIEMEDVEAAKELLDEVIKEGSEEQKQEAESILAKIV
ncbi:MAG TPA: AAA family ATPase, partial [Alteromonas mediterranea]|nr:AAA family ATPase [Alteromonas mediterranea]